MSAQASALKVCGVDFGTSNSTVSVPSAQGASLIALEGNAPTLPTAVFLETEGAKPHYGRAAVAAYVDGEDGRLMRGLKSTLGSSLIHEKTKVGNRAVAFTEIIGRFIGHLNGILTAHQGETRHAVFGRPVHFVDDDAEGDAQAEAVLGDIARAQGFTHVEFQFEPIAAALAHEATVAKEELVLIVDIGGGTSDFSIVRVSPEGAKRADRSGDILANHGIRLGGTDLDRVLSLAQIMPELGMGSLVHHGKSPMPAHYYLNLATWSRINALYVPQVAREIKELRYDASQPDLLDRLIEVLEERHGHALAMRAEDAKIALSSQQSTQLVLKDLIGARDKLLSRTGFEDTVSAAMNRLTMALAQVLAQAGVTPMQIGTVFMTGGSANLPVLRRMVEMCLPGVKIATGDMFGSVGSGLALDAARRFA